MAKIPAPTAYPNKKPQAKAQKARPTETSTAARPWMNYLIVVLVITFGCYFSSLRNELVNWDDDPNITENKNIERVGIDPFTSITKDIFDLDKGNVIGNYNPLPILTFAIEKKIAGGISPRLIHTDNLLLHLGTVLFVFLLLLQMGFGNWGAFVGGLLFGIHPMRVESVAWATERKDVLFAIFFFAALYYYVKWLKDEDPGKRTRIYIVMLILGTLSMFSKVQAVTLPLSMLALDYWFRRKLDLRFFLDKIPFFGLALMMGIFNLITLKAQGSTTDDITNFNFIDRLCIGAYSFSVYTYKLFYPYPMSPLYPYPKVLPSYVYFSPVFFFLIVGIFAWLAVKGRRTAVFGMLFFFFNVMFLLQVFGAGQGYLADRFTYVPYFGFFVIAAWLYERSMKEEKLRVVAQVFTVLFFLMCAVATVRQIGVWKNGETLWSHVMTFEGEGSSLPYWNRGQYYRNKAGNYDAALKDYSKAIEIQKNNPELLNSRGKTYFDMAMSGKYKAQETAYVRQAIDDYTTALKIPDIKPKSRAEVLINRGAAMGAVNNFQQSIVDLTEGLLLDPNNKNGYFNRSIAYYNSQQYDNALADYKKYLELDPYDANIWYEAGMLQRSKNMNQEAITSLNNAIRLKPDLGLAYLERARAYAQAGNKAAAQQDYERAKQKGQKLIQLDQQLMEK